MLGRYGVPRNGQWNPQLVIPFIRQKLSSLHMLQVYFVEIPVTFLNLGQNPRSVADSQGTVVAIQQRIENLNQARGLTNETIEWLSNNGDMKQNKREPNAKQLKKLLRKLDDKESDLRELEGNQAFIYLSTRNKGCCSVHYTH